MKSSIIMQFTMLQISLKQALSLLEILEPNRILDHKNLLIQSLINQQHYHLNEMESQQAHYNSITHLLIELDGEEQ